MANDEPQGNDKRAGADAAGGEHAGEWAEALVDQKDGGLDEDPPGGVLSGDRPARPFGGTGEGQVNDINMVLDIPVQLSVVELDALAGERMDVLVNGYLIAQGEVVVVNDKFGIRLTDVVTPSERLRRINKG